MKNLLIATDFSENAKHAAEYGYMLAKLLKVNIVLCNAYIIPAEVPQASAMVWPEFEYEELMNDYERNLNNLKQYLEEQHGHGDFKPAIHCVNEPGSVTGLVNELVRSKDIGMIIMGMHGNSALGSLLLGNHSRMMIETATVPLLLAPQNAKIAPFKKVAFATDFKDFEKDLEAIYALIPVLRLLDAELLITHVYDEKAQSPRFKKFIDDFLVDISNNADYPHIYYRMIKNSTPERGLDWLCEHGQVDMLAMVHRKHSLLNKLLKGSHTQKMAGHINVPLLVIPEN